MAYNYGQQPYQPPKLYVSAKSLEKLKAAADKMEGAVGKAMRAFLLGETSTPAPVVDKWIPEGTLMAIDEAALIDPAIFDMVPKPKLNPPGSFADVADLVAKYPPPAFFTGGLGLDLKGFPSVAKKPATALVRERLIKAQSKLMDVLTLKPDDPDEDELEAMGRTDLVAAREGARAALREVNEALSALAWYGFSEPPGGIEAWEKNEHYWDVTLDAPPLEYGPHLWFGGEKPSSYGAFQQSKPWPLASQAGGAGGAAGGAPGAGDPED